MSHSKKKLKVSQSIHNDIDVYDDCELLMTTTTTTTSTTAVDLKKSDISSQNKSTNTTVNTNDIINTLIDRESYTKSLEEKLNKTTAALTELQEKYDEIKNYKEIVGRTSTAIMLLMEDPGKYIKEIESINNTVCAICMESGHPISCDKNGTPNAGDILWTICGHCRAPFHKPCFMKYEQSTAKSTLCPVCRQSFKVDEYGDKLSSLYPMWKTTRFVTTMAKETDAECESLKFHGTGGFSEFEFNYLTIFTTLKLPLKDFVDYISSSNTNQ